MRLFGLSLVLLASPVVGQEHLFLDFDSVPDCDILKDGTFLNIDQSKTAYYMVVKDGIQTEYVQDGKYYVKSRMEWLSACSYRSIVIEVTIPDYNVKPGESATTEIFQTLCNEYVKFKAQMGKSEMISVYHKMDPPPCH
ncbi:MAG: hypothetical protein WAT74_04365 [Flavobacteriales bacterium]